MIVNIQVKITPYCDWILDKEHVISELYEALTRISYIHDTETDTCMPADVDVINMEEE
jgi:hypothetical protein